MGTWGYEPRQNDDFMEVECEVVVPMMEVMRKKLVRKPTKIAVHRAAHEWRSIALLTTQMYDVMLSADEDLLQKILVGVQDKLELLRSSDVAKDWRSEWNSEVDIVKAIGKQISENRRLILRFEKRKTEEAQNAPKYVGGGRWSNPK